jgi:hypothetical protein
MKSFKIPFFLGLIFTFFYSLNSFSQQGLSKEEVSKYVKMTNDAEGTYQIQLIDTRAKPTTQLSIINSIENKRENDKVAYFYVNSFTRVKVLSKKEINSTTFKPLERYKYISSSELDKN